LEVLIGEHSKRLCSEGAKKGLAIIGQNARL